jgi:hypothetical protein
MGGIEALFADLEAKAAAAYEAEVARFEAKIAIERELMARELADPATRAALGLPTQDMPAESIRVLAHCMAMDRHGDSMPRRDKVYARYGLT